MPFWEAGSSSKHEQVLHDGAPRQAQTRLALTSTIQRLSILQVQRQLAGSSGDAPLLSLGIHSSEVAELPACIGRLHSLQVLDLSGCASLKRLPPSLGDLSSLQVLDLSGCPLLLPSDEQLRSLQRPAEARLAAQQLWAAIRSEQKQQSIMEAGGADRLVGVLASEDAGDPLRASICSIVRVLACNLTYCSRLAAAGAGPVLLRLFCRDDFCSDGLAQQRAAPGRALLQMSAFKVSPPRLVLHALCACSLHGVLAWATCLGASCPAGLPACCSAAFAPAFSLVQTSLLVLGAHQNFLLLTSASQADCCSARP